MWYDAKYLASANKMMAESLIYLSQGNQNGFLVSSLTNWAIQSEQLTDVLWVQTTFLWLHTFILPPNKLFFYNWTASHRNVSNELRLDSESQIAFKLRKDLT